MDAGSLLEVRPDLEDAISIHVEAEPRAIQSVRFSSRMGFVQTYQPKKNKDWKTAIKTAVYSQLPQGWKMFEHAPLCVCVMYVFSALKSFTRQDKEIIQRWDLILKDSRPDVNDNLNKGLYDALTGVLWDDDSRASWATSVKVYGKDVGIYITVGRLSKILKVPTRLSTPSCF